MTVSDIQSDIILILPKPLSAQGLSISSISHNDP
jgi:hypothetical protein